MLIKKLFSSQLFASTAIYTFSSFFNQGVPFILLPVMTRYLSPQDYGIVSIGIALQGLILPWVGLSTSTAVVRKYFDKTINFQKYVGNALYIWAFSSLIIIVIFTCSSTAIEKFSGFPQNWQWAILLIVILRYPIGLSLSLLQIRNRPASYGFFENSTTLMNCLLAVLFVVGLSWNWKGRVLADVFSCGIAFAVACYLLHKENVQFRYQKSYVMHSLRYSIPLIPHILGATIITFSDRLFIANMVSIERVGQYSVGYNIGMVIGLLELSFNKAYMPWLFEKLSTCTEQFKIEIVKFTYMFFAGILLIAIALSLITPWFLSFYVGEKFASSGQFVIWIALGYAFNGMYKMVVKFITYSEKTYYLSYVTFFSVCLNLVLNYLLISRYGAIGAAQATTLTFFVSFIITWIISARTYKMPWLLRS